MSNPKNTRQPTSHIAPFGVRMQPELKARIEATAEAAGRSLNAEIVARLEESLRAPGLRAANERRKLELLSEYVEWCAREDVSPNKSFGAFARAYEAAVADAPDETSALEPVSSIDQVEPHYLAELYANWIIERPDRFPALSDMHPPPAQIVTRQPTTASQPALALLAFLCRSILEADQDNKAGLDADDKRSANLFLSAQLHAIATVADVAKFVPLVDKIINAVTSESAEPTAKPKKKKS